VCEHFLGLRPELAGIVRQDPRVPEAIRQQAPFLLRTPISPAAQDIEALARHFAGPR
jgi:flagellar biosynthesis protein FlhG